MREAAKQFEFEKAAQLRDRIKVLKEKATSALMGVEQSTSQEVEASGGQESSGQQA
jgi:excinuclease UvrABC nuclease subunit